MERRRCQIRRKSPNAVRFTLDAAEHRLMLIMRWPRPRDALCKIRKIYGLRPNRNSPETASGKAERSRTCANVNATALTLGARRNTIGRPLATPEKPQGMCLDKGYDYPVIREILLEYNYTAHVRSRGEEKLGQTMGRRTPSLQWLARGPNSPLK